MKKIHSVEEYLEENPQFSEALTLLRDIMLSTELEEAIKWSFPVYTLNNKNVVSLGAFKNHFGIWFFNGVFLKDEQDLLTNAQDGKTKAMRQMRFESIADIDKNVVLAYVKEAIENQKLGKEVKPDRRKKSVVIPEELQQAFKENTELKSSFENLSNYKQREYFEHISSAKREATKQSRLEKIIPMIIQGVGLHDKYKNC
ncbi:YdeI/OmpD-associated family protein [Hyunsoonleella rubra]|uniref:YdeI family protein n=1 Tax=Hyunsoonleella rubra TaxID=1737062 RepID=A0ABW5TDT2_9FLAO